jgi:phosphoglycolate phosphatase
MPFLIFDLDGTLADPRAGILRCIGHALAHAGASAPRDVQLEQYIGPPLRDVFASILGAEDPRIDAAFRAFREEYGTQGLFEKHLYPGILETLRALQDLAPGMFIATSKPREFAERIAAHFDLTSFFRGIYGCELTGERADKAELLAHLLQEQSLDPADAVMIGDRKYDVAAARANGIRSIGVTWGYGSLDELTQAGADTICHSPADLIRCYTGMYNPPPGL